MANRPFPSSPGPLYQNECSAFDVEMIFHSHANKTHFDKKGFALMAHFESEGFWNSEVAFSAIRLDIVNDPSFFLVFFFATALCVGNVLYN